MKISCYLKHERRIEGTNQYREIMKKQNFSHILRFDRRNEGRTIRKNNDENASSFKSVVENHQKH